MTDMKLYEIADALRSVIERGYKVDEETGEILFETEDLDALDMALAEKCESTALYIREQEAQIAAIKAEIKRLRDLQASKENALKRLKEWTVANIKLLPGERCKGDFASLSIRHTESVQVLDEEAIPEQYMRVKVSTTPDKTAIKKAIKAGEDVPGCALVVNESLAVR